jgi:anaerobic C4-dicarboxylate transporter
MTPGALDPDPIDPTTPESLAVIAAQVGITVAPERLDVVSAFVAGLSAGLDSLRAVPLSFLDPIEPATALRWIARGGRSVPT